MLRLLGTLLVVAGLLPARLDAHQALQGAAPAAGASLSSVPGEIRLSFSQAVHLELAELRLVGPGGAEIALGEMSVPADAPTVLAARIVGPLQPGSYHVQWLVTGDDGHPVRGGYDFTVEAGAAGLATVEPEPTPPPAPAPPEPATQAGAAAMQVDHFDAESPLFAVVRWLTFVGLVIAVGTAAFRLLVVPLTRYQEAGVTPAAEAGMARGAAAVGLAAGAVLAVALVLRLLAQAGALGVLEAGGAGGSERLVFMLTGTLWGWGWIVQAVGVAALLVGGGLARRGAAMGWGVLAGGAVALCCTPALSGHAAATSGPAIVADSLHVLAAGGWLGTLLLVVAVGIPTLRAAGVAATPAAAALVRAFSPLALFFAALLALTGVYAAWVHLGSVSALSGTAYGRTLLVKLGVLAVVFAAGAHNWLRVRPALVKGGDVRRLRRSAGLELAVGLLVLAVTAVLVATPPPAEARMVQAPPPSAAATLP